MSSIRLLSQDGAFKIVSSAPSINNTPVGPKEVPLPYQVIADLSEAEGCVKTVFFGTKPAYVLGQSFVPKCRGDDPGTGKGLKSGTLNGENKPTSASPTVFATGKAVVRQGDTSDMQGGNTVGTHVAQPAPVPPSPSGRPEPDMDPVVTPETPEEEAWLEARNESDPRDAKRGPVKGGPAQPKSSRGVSKAERSTPSNAAAGKRSPGGSGCGAVSKPSASEEELKQMRWPYTREGAAAHQRGQLEGIKEQLKANLDPGGLKRSSASARQGELLRDRLLDPHAPGAPQLTDASKPLSYEYWEWEEIWRRKALKDTVAKLQFAEACIALAGSRSGFAPRGMGPKAPSLPPPSRSVATGPAQGIKNRGPRGPNPRPLGVPLVPNTSGGGSVPGKGSKGGISSSHTQEAPPPSWKTGDAAFGELSEVQTQNLKRFLDKAPANSTNLRVRQFLDGSAVFQIDSPAANIPGSFATYEKQVDALSKTLQFTKTTYAPDGSIVHIAPKYPPGPKLYPGR